MPGYYNLNKAANSMDKDFKRMESSAPEMNQPITEQNQHPVYDAGQSLKDAVQDAEKKFGSRKSTHENVFLWTDKKDAWMKMEKYREFSDKNNKELKDYSARYINHSARKRASSSAEAKAQYKKYNVKMQKLSVMAEELDAFDNLNSAAGFKEVKKFFNQSMEALDLREAAMKAAAEVKSINEADENFRKAKITRMILAQKLNLARKYRNKYRESRETREMEDYFQNECDKLKRKFALFLYDYKMAYLAARGNVDSIKLEEVAPVENEHVENEQNRVENEHVENEQNVAGNEQNVAENVDVNLDDQDVDIRVGRIKSKFGEAGNTRWKDKLREGGNQIYVNPKLENVREALERISGNQDNKYNNQLDKIRYFGRSNPGTTILKLHRRKGHSYSKKDEIVFRIDLLGTKDSVDIDPETIAIPVENFIRKIGSSALLGDDKKERDAYFKWLKEVKHHESMENIDLNAVDAQFRHRQQLMAEQNVGLIVDYFSYKKLGKNNEDPALEHVNKGIRVRQAEHNVPEHLKELREGQKRELITINGCDSYLGGGEFSIEAAAGYMKELAKARLTPIFDSWTNGTAQPKTIRFMLDGLSRGGVNASLGAMAINGWVAEAYPQYAKYVKYDLIQRDPVPGPSTATLKDSIKIGGAALDQELDKNGFIKGTKFKPLSKAATNSTVFYSLHPAVGKYSPFYQPQRVYGANRIILSVFEHTDNGKMPGVFDDFFKNKTKSRAMLNNSNGEFYAGSGISDLDDGVYVLDEYSTLTKIDSYEDAVKVLNITRNDHIYSKRKARILDVLKVWFIEHNANQGGNVANGR